MNADSSIQESPAWRRILAPVGIIFGSLAAFGKPEPIKLAGRHSVILKFDGKDSFAQLCQKLQSR